MRKRLSGLILLSVGVGMLLMLFLTLIMPHWGFLLAALLVVVGFWFLFGC